MVGFRGRLCWGLWVVLIGGQILGCGGNPYRLATVRGRVTCQGKPATGGEVVFQPIDAPEKTGRASGQSGRPSRGTVEADGTFTLTCDLIADGKPGESAPGALLGPHRVVFKMPRTTRPTMDADTRLVLSGPEHKAELKAAEEALTRVPVYAPLPCSDKITPGEVEVKAGKNEFEFTLQPK
jgi:hypothetical protein